MITDKKILFVDDEAMIADTILRFLKAKGFVYSFVAKTPKEALSIIEKEKPDLIILDIQLEAPIDGIEVLRRTKQSLSPSSQVVMLSGHKDIYEKESFDLGAVEFWGKPMLPKQLVEGIHRILGA